MFTDSGRNAQELEQWVQVRADLAFKMLELVGVVTVELIRKAVRCVVTVC